MKKKGVNKMKKILLVFIALIFLHEFFLAVPKAKAQTNIHLWCKAIM